MHLITTQYILCVSFLCTPFLQSSYKSIKWFWRCAELDSREFGLCTPLTCTHHRSVVRHRRLVREWRHQCSRFHAPGACNLDTIGWCASDSKSGDATQAPPICIKLTGAWCVESAAPVVPLTHWAPVTHHRTVVGTCHWWVVGRRPNSLEYQICTAPEPFDTLVTGLVWTRIYKHSCALHFGRSLTGSSKSFI